MAELIGLVLLAVGVVVFLLPLLSLVRVAALSRDVAELRRRVQALEPRSPAAAQPDAPPVPAAPPIVSPPRVPVPSAEAETLEQRVGSRWLLYTGVLIVIIGVSFFLKYAFDSDWIGERARVLAGATAGIALMAWGSRVAARGLDRFGLALVGTGVSVLYLSAYAALAFYALIGPGVAFTLFSAITVTAAWLAHRARSQALAVLAVIGGYLTPTLVGGTTDQQTALFTYDFILGAGVLALFVYHEWLWLPALSLAATVLTVTAWADAWYTERAWLVTLGYVTAYLVLFVAMLKRAAASTRPGAGLVVAALWTSPALYHLGTIALTWWHPPALHLYLIAFTLLCIWRTTEPHRGWLRVLALVSVYLPLLAYVSQRTAAPGIGIDVIAALAIAAMHFAGVLDLSVRQTRPLTIPDLLLVHVAGIGLFGILSQTLALNHPELRGSVAALLAIGATGLWMFLQSRDALASQNAAGLAFTLTAIAIAVQLEGRLVVVAWGVEGAVAAWMGLRAASAGFRVGGLALWGLAVAKLSDGYLTIDAPARPLINQRSLATLVLIVAAYVLAALWKRFAASEAAERQDRAIPSALQIAASVLTLAWITAEALSYWDVRSGLPKASLYAQLTLSLSYAAYAAVLVGTGLAVRQSSLRWIGMAVMALTVAKVFVVDLSGLAGIYRVTGFIIVGLLLMGVSYLYQRRPDGSTPGYTPDPDAPDHDH